ncbi:MAG: hypothetical protein HDR19_06475 [Lachnospiraceae bacterium]|nr:hypothetical protein [Lachnospiraceae bacterium]
MHNLRYVTRKQLSPVKKELVLIINNVQNLIRKDFTFQFYFVGSAERNMVTYDVGTNKGFDFDVNIQVNNSSDKFTAEQIKTKIRLALDRIAPKFGFDYAEDSTRVLTIKVKDRKKSRILYSCDFAIVNDYIDDDGNGGQEYIHFNKRQNKYSWKEQSQGFYLLEEKAEWINDNGYWQKVRALYLDKKNQNNDPNKHSRSIYAETIHEICQKYGYYN